jgi:glycosyltransferase involved in cell wall biosynthesis
MRILFMGPYPPVRDGIGEFTWMLAHELQQAGHEIGVVVPYRAPGFPAEVLGSLAAAPRERDRLRAALPAWRPDVVHVQFAIAGFGTRTVALLRWLTHIRRDLGVPVLVTMHEPAREAASLPVLGRAAQRAVARRCDHVIVHTQLARSAVTAGLGVPPARISMTALPDGRFRAASSTPAGLRARFGLGQARVLLAFGYIHVDKGLDDLVDGLRILRESTPAVLDGLRVVVAGDVRPRPGLFRIMGARDLRYRARLDRRIARSGLAGMLIRTGWVPDGDVAAWFDLASAVVLPYREAEQSGVEALARSAGVPVLASSAGGLAEQQPGALRLTFPPRSPGRLAQTLADFLTAAGQPPVGAGSVPQSDARPAQPGLGRDRSARADQGDAGTAVAPVAAATLDVYRAVTKTEPARVTDVS